MMNGYGMGAGGWTIMIIVWIALLALIGLAIARIFPSAGGGSSDQRPAAASPERLLDERLARGEIDVETYERLRGVLSRRGEGG
jgi:putative membrane protein